MIICILQLHQQQQQQNTLEKNKEKLHKNSMDNCYSIIL